MKKMKLATMLIQGAALIALAGGIYFYTQNQVKPQEVYAFNRVIPVNTTIQEGDLIRKSIPKDAVTTDMITNINEVVGKCTTSKSFPDQYVVKQQLVDATEIDAFSQIDLSNYRKISIETNAKIAVGGNLKKGDKVDLTFIKQAQGTGTSGNDTFTYSKIFMEDVLVYSVLDDKGKKFTDQTDGNVTTVDEAGNTIEGGALSIVTLAVKPDQAEEISARLKAGAINIIGRFEENEGTATNSPGYVIGSYIDIPTEKTNPEK